MDTATTAVAGVASGRCIDAEYTAAAVVGCLAFGYWCFADCQNHTATTANSFKTDANLVGISFVVDKSSYFVGPGPSFGCSGDNYSANMCLAVIIEHYTNHSQTAAADILKLTNRYKEVYYENFMQPMLMNKKLVLDDLFDYSQVLFQLSWTFTFSWEHLLLTCVEEVQDLQGVLRVVHSFC